MRDPGNGKRIATLVSAESRRTRIGGVFRHDVTPVGQKTRKKLSGQLRAVLEITDDMRHRYCLDRATRDSSSRKVFANSTFWPSLTYIMKMDGVPPTSPFDV